MNEIERKQKIYQEIMEEAKLKDPNKRPNEFSCRDFSRELLQQGIICGRDRAKRLLDEKVEQGLLTRRVIKHGIYYSVV